MLRALGTTLAWMVFDQRTLIARGFSRSNPFSIEMLVPLYTGGSLTVSRRFRRCRVVFFCDPDHFSEIHRKSSETIDASSAYSFLKPYFGNESIFVKTGLEHAPAKQAVYRAIREYLKIGIDDLIFFHYAILERFRQGTYAALKPLQEVTAAFLLRSIFSSQGTDLASETIEKAIGAATNASGAFLLLPNLLRWTRRFGVGLEIRRQKIHLRRFVRQKLDSLNLAQHWPGKTAEEARTEIIDNLMTLLIAGFETTATTIAWLLYELARDRKLQAELRAEVQLRLKLDPLEYLADDSSLLAKCVHETLRLHPAIPFVLREVRQPLELGGFQLMADDYIVLSTEECHRRGFADGDQFDPQREATDGRSAKLATFGGGAKICPGRSIAVDETRVVTALLISHYVVQTTDQTRDTIIRNQISATPMGGMVLAFQALA